MTKIKEVNTRSEKYSSIIHVLLLALAIPLALLLWFGNVLLLYVSNRVEDDLLHIPPTRWLAAILIPLTIASLGLKKKSVNKSGAITGFFVGFVLTISNYCFLSCLMTFFITSSKATKFKSEKKKKLEEEFKEGGQRNWVQVVCNGSVATVLALLYILDYGCGELPINFTTHYRASWLSIGVLGAFACCNGDTWASELGTVVDGEPFLITNFQKVPKGTNGGVTLEGLLFSFLGGLLIGISYYLTVIYSVDPKLLLLSPPQWPLILVGAAAGFVGSLIDSILGATLQFSGIDRRTGCVVEHPGEHIIHISGNKLLDNHSVNLLSCALMGYLSPVLSNFFWLQD